MERINNKRYDSKYNSEYKERIAELIEYILNKKYGEIISHKEASNILKYNIEIEKEFKRYQAQMIKIKNFLIDYGYMLKGIAGVGYYILTPKQIAGHCYRTYIVKTQRLLEKSNKILINTDISELSEIRKEEHDNILKLNNNLNNNIDKVIQTSGYYNRKEYYNNLKD